MSRFAGLPDRNTAPAPGARFASLPKRLAAMSRPERFDYVRANAISEPCIEAAVHRDEMALLASGKSSAAKVAAVTPRPNVALRADAPHAAASPPPPKLGRAETVALALRTDPKLAGYQDIALHMLDDPELKSLSGDGVVRCLKGLDPAAYRASMAKERAAKADAVWERAWAWVDGGLQAAAAPQNAKTKAELVWERAYAKMYRHP